VMIPVAGAVSVAMLTAAVGAVRVTRPLGATLADTSVLVK